MCTEQERRQHKTGSTKESLGLLATDFLGWRSFRLPLSGEEGGDASKGGLLMKSVSIEQQSLKPLGKREK